MVSPRALHGAETRIASCPGSHVRCSSQRSTWAHDCDETYRQAPRCWIEPWKYISLSACLKLLSETGMGLVVLVSLSCCHESIPTRCRPGTRPCRWLRLARANSIYVSTGEETRRQIRVGVASEFKLSTRVAFAAARPSTPAYVGKESGT
jgi:hypothetical protein